MIRRAPRSTLFLYAMLVRSILVVLVLIFVLVVVLVVVLAVIIVFVAIGMPGFLAVFGLAGAPRSEVHTSELQSRQYIVCRVLLEKKKSISTVKPVIIFILIL